MNAMTSRICHKLTMLPADVMAAFPSPLTKGSATSAKWLQACPQSIKTSDSIPVTKSFDFFCDYNSTDRMVRDESSSQATSSFESRMSIAMNLVSRIGRYVCIYKVLHTFVSGVMYSSQFAKYNTPRILHCYQHRICCRVLRRVVQMCSLWHLTHDRR